MFIFFDFECQSCVAVDGRDPSITWAWCSAGVLDYDPDSKLYLVQKVNKKNRIIDEQGKPVVNGYIVNGEF